MSQLLLTTLGVVCPNCDELSQPGTAKCPSCGSDPYGATPPAKALSRAASAGISMGGRPPSGTHSTNPAFGVGPTPPPFGTGPTPAPQRIPAGSISTAPTPQAPLPASARTPQVAIQVPPSARPSGPKQPPAIP